MNKTLAYILQDVLENKFSAKKMFGSYGIYYFKDFVGIYHNGEFYVKKGDNNLDVFEKNGEICFEYIKQNKKAYLKNYLKINSNFLEDSQKLTEIFIKSNILKQKFD